MFDPRRADQRSLAEKLVGLIMAASEEDLAEARAQLSRISGKSKRAAQRGPSFQAQSRGQ